MRTFNVVVRLDGKALRFCALGRCSADIVCQCFNRFCNAAGSAAVSISVRG